MLLSMTGFGAAQSQNDALAVVVEIRTVNNRHLKLSTKTPDGYGPLEGELEAKIRGLIKRGSVQVSLRVDRARRAEDYRLNATALASYRAQLEQLSQTWQLEQPWSLDNLVLLPGVVEESRNAASPEDEWPLVGETIDRALAQLDQMRRQEGEAMAQELSANIARIRAELSQIAERAPKVAADYRARLEDRISNIMSERQATLDPADLIREVGIFAERSDITEEIVRLRSHLEQFDGTMAGDESSGRKLDFLTQEMFREINTIGAKANDSTIAQHVVEIKAAIDKIRELVQNVE